MHGALAGSCGRNDHARPLVGVCAGAGYLVGAAPAPIEAVQRVAAATAGRPLGGGASLVRSSSSPTTRSHALVGTRLARTALVSRTRLRTVRLSWVEPFARVRLTGSPAVRRAVAKITADAPELVGRDFPSYESARRPSSATVTVTTLQAHTRSPSRSCRCRAYPRRPRDVRRGASPPARRARLRSRGGGTGRHEHEGSDLWLEARRSCSRSRQETVASLVRAATSGRR